MGKNDYRVGGTRGGQDQFNWDSVKDDKHRENYLGHSVNASVGRWQRGKNLNWYANGKSNEATDDMLKEEKRLAREAEEDMMRKRLGLPPINRERAAPNVRLDEKEKRDLLKRGGAQADAEISAEAAYGQQGDELYGTEKIGGLGSFKPARHDGSETVIQSSMAPQDRLEGSSSNKRFAASGGALGDDWQRASSSGGGGGGGSSGRRLGPERPPGSGGGGEEEEKEEADGGEARERKHHKEHKREKHHKRDKEHRKHHKRDKEHKRDKHHSSRRDREEEEEGTRRRHDSDDEDEPAAAPAKRQRHDSDSD